VNREGGQEHTSHSRLRTQKSSTAICRAAKQQIQALPKSDIAERHGSTKCAEDPVPIFVLSTTPANETARMTSNSPPSTTASKTSPKKSAQASFHLCTRQDVPICAAYWSSGKSLRRF